MSTLPIRTAVIPAAGLGTRLAPLTRFIPKELLPVANVPLIEYALREAHESGIRRNVVITGAGKTVLEEYLADRAETAGAAAEQGEIVVVRQPEPRGLGDAVACARKAVGGEPFAVLLPDTLFDAETSALAQLLAARSNGPMCLVATQEVAPELVPLSGIVALKPMVGGGRLARVTSLVEKPALNQAPSRYAILGRYVLQPDIFDCLASTPPGANGEVQLTDALRLYLAKGDEPEGNVHNDAKGRVCAVRVEGECYDAGDKLGYLVANAAFGLHDPVFGEELRAALGALIRRGRRAMRGSLTLSANRRGL
jgi:UTP--glucose-1-phosphate uridylyltransferase